MARPIRWIAVATVAGCVLNNPLIAGPPRIPQSQVKGLLVIQLPNGSYAGTASQMNATAVPLGDTGAFDVRFNQEVGEMMQAATVEVGKLMRVRHQTDLPTGHCIEFAFANKHSAKDGPSAAVACALMAESIITGEELDQGLAVTGDLTATGEVRPIGGVGAKVRGAAKRECSLMAVPKANQTAIQDIYVLEGIVPLVEAQVILIGSFDDAWQIARTEKAAAIQQALEDFKAVQAAVGRNPGNASHPKVIAKLKSILEAMPNHESARLIALHGVGRGPKKLSLAGSLTAIQTAAQQLSSSLKDGSYMNTGSEDPLWENVSLLSRLRGDVDPRTTNYLDAFLRTSSFIKQIRSRKQWTPALDRELKEAVARIHSEEAKLTNNQQIQGELMNQ